MKRLLVAFVTSAAGLWVSGCSIGGLASIGPVASAPVVAPVPAPVVYGAFLDGPVGQKLGPADKDKAFAAEQAALASGQRRTWKGEHGIYGYVEPEAVAADGTGSTCRPFTSTIYLGGRPQVGHGRGCQAADGSWTVG